MYQELGGGGGVQPQPWLPRMPGTTGPATTLAAEGAWNPRFPLPIKSVRLTVDWKRVHIYSYPATWGWDRLPITELGEKPTLSESRVLVEVTPPWWFILHLSCLKGFNPQTPKGEVSCTVQAF